MGTKKKIRKVMTTSGEYYVYDIVVNEEGKKKRIYGKSENEVKSKVENMGFSIADNSKFSFSNFEANEGQFSEYASYYFKKELGIMPIQKLRHLIGLFGNTVNNTELDTHITKITEKQIKRYFNKLTDLYSEDDVRLMYDAFRKIFSAANSEGITQNIKVPVPDFRKVADMSRAVYILSPEEYDKFVDFCLKDDGVLYGRNEQIILLALLTGIQVSSMKRILVKDVNLGNKTIIADNTEIKLPDKCVKWLVSQVERGRLAAVDESGNIVSYYGTKRVSEDELPKGNGVISISRYTSQPDELFIVNSNGNFPTTQSIYFTLQRMSMRLGLPKGINVSALFKSYVIYEINKGTTIAELQERFKIRNPKVIIDIQDEYEVRKALFG